MPSVGDENSPNTAETGGFLFYCINELYESKVVFFYQAVISLT